MQQSQSTSRHMLSNPDLTRVSERRRYLKKVKPNKHRGLLNALKTGPDQTKRLRSCFIESRDQLKSRTSRSCAYIRPLNSRGVKRSLSIGRDIEIQRRGTIEACRESDEACGNESPHQECTHGLESKQICFDNASVPGSAKCRRGSSCSLPAHKTYLQRFLLESFVRPLSSCSACRRGFFGEAHHYSHSL